MSVVLWPRQEVLQLVLPQLATCGRLLTQKLIEEIILKLSKVQNSDGQISLSDWIPVAQEMLKWNDSCIYLFWDMLSLAVYYLNSEKLNSLKRDEVAIDIECVAVFLILHIPEPSSVSKHNTITSTFDSVWPLNPEGEVYPTSPVPSPMSPVKDANKNLKSPTPMGSPMSPRSPKNSPGQVAASSPKRAINTAARTPRGSTQHLHSVRQKIPLIVSALNPNLSKSHSYDVCDDYSSSIEAYNVTRKIVDAFGMMLSGGHSRDQTVSPFSSLHPLWSEHDPTSARNSQELHPMNISDLNNEILTSKDLISWINLHLSMNDLIYPVSMHVITTNNVGSSPSIMRTGGDAMGQTTILTNPDLEGKEGTKGNPQKVISSVATLSRFSPTVINSNQTTLIHVVTLGPSRSSSFRRINTRSHDYTMGTSNSNLDHLFNNTNSSNLSDQLLKLSFANRNSNNPTGYMQHHNSADYDSEMDSASVHEYGMSTDITEFDPASRAIVNTNLGSPISPSKQLFSPRDGKNLSPLSFQNLSKLEDKTKGYNNAPSNTSNMDESESITKFPESSPASSHPEGITTNLNKSSKDLFATNNSENAFFGNNYSGFNALSNPNANNFKPEVSLPQLFLNYSNNSKYYFISPYYSATITGCINCELVIGSVYGAVILSGCENLKITVTCRKLIVLNCMDCEIYLATISPTIFSGDCRNIAVGPINATYRNYRHHLKLTELKSLIKSNNTLPADSNKSHNNNTNSHHHPFHDDPVNQWAKFCDVNACLDGGNKLLTSNALNTALSPTKLSMKKVFCDNLPVPSPATARIMPVDRFHVVTIPIKSEFLSFEFSPIAVPSEYTESLKKQQESTELIKNQISHFLQNESKRKEASNQSSPAGSDVEDEIADTHRKTDLTTKLLASSTVSKKFMEWLVSSGNAQEVLDLIRIDSDKSTNIHQ